ncbi:hypothetical protein D3C76_1222810 [compost metagenome]
MPSKPDHTYFKPRTTVTMAKTKYPTVLIISITPPVLFNSSTIELPSFSFAGIFVGLKNLLPCPKISSNKPAYELFTLKNRVIIRIKTIIPFLYISLPL